MPRRQLRPGVAGLARSRVRRQLTTVERQKYLSPQGEAAAGKSER
jgi:hypothetical protein